MLAAIDFLSTAGMYVSGIGVFCMALFITLEITSRHLFGYSLLVVDEWSGYLLVFVTFLGLAYTMKSNGFLQIEFFLNRLPSRSRRVFHFVLILLALLYGILIDYRLMSYTWSSYVTGQVSISISQTPLYIPRLFMPLGMSLLVLELLRESILSLLDLSEADRPNRQKGRDRVP